MSGEALVMTPGGGGSTVVPNQEPADSNPATPTTPAQPATPVAAAAPPVATPPAQAGTGGPERLFTQEQFNKALAERLEHDRRNSPEFQALQTQLNELKTFAEEQAEGRKSEALRAAALASGVKADAVPLFLKHVDTSGVQVTAAGVEGATEAVTKVITENKELLSGFLATATSRRTPSGAAGSPPQGTAPKTLSDQLREKVQAQRNTVVSSL